MTHPPEKRIYLDHAATSYPKPEKVLLSVQSYLQNIGASAGRGAYQEAFEAKNILDQTRSEIASLFNISNPQRIIFTFNATDALNLGLKGILNSGDHVITSSIEHNSISRPLLHLQKKLGTSFTKTSTNLDGEIDWSQFQSAISSKTKLIAFIHGSNVSGTLTPIAEIGEYARKHRIPFLVDASQTAGSYPIDVEAMKIDLLAFPGHKGLLGPLGTGALWVREGIELKTLREGGTGSFSEEDQQPLNWPDIHESGSHNLVGIAGLQASVQYLKEKGIEKIRKHKENLMRQFLEGIHPLKKTRIIAPSKVEKNAGVISLQFEGLNPNQVATGLDEEFRIQVRPGLHCSPWAHQSFQTYPEGTVRFSFGESNSEKEIEAVIQALKKI